MHNMSGNVLHYYQGRASKKSAFLVPKDEVKIVSQIQLPAAPLRNPQKHQNSPLFISIAVFDVSEPSYENRSPEIESCQR